MMTNYKINAMSIKHATNKKLLLAFLDEMRFDIKHTGNQSTRDKKLVKLITTPAIRAGPFKNEALSITRFLSSDLFEFFDRLKLLLYEKQAGSFSKIIFE